MSLRSLAAVVVMAAVGIAFAAVAPSAHAEDMVKLKIELPKPMFIGTPKNIKSPNLEKPNTKRRPIMVPADAKNVALGKPVTSSDDAPIIGELEQITDGDKEAADGSFVELGPDPQWVQIDLGAPHKIYAVAVWHYHSQARVYHDVVIQLSNDPDFIEGVQTVFSNDHDNSLGLGVGRHKEYVETNIGRVADAKGTEARYVRLYSNGNTTNDMNHYIEVEVYGTPAS